MTGAQGYWLMELLELQGVWFRHFQVNNHNFICLIACSIKRMMVTCVLCAWIGIIINGLLWIWLHQKDGQRHAAFCSTMMLMWILPTKIRLDSSERSTVLQKIFWQKGLTIGLRNDCAPCLWSERLFWVNIHAREKKRQRQTDLIWFD